MNPIGIVFRRIIYAIPLKLLLILLAVFSVFYACFSSAENVEDLVINIKSGTESISSNNTFIIQNINGNYGTYCLKVNSISSNSSSSLKYGFSRDGTYNSYNPITIYSDWQSPFYVCIYSNLDYILLHNPSTNSVSIEYEFFKLNALLNTQLPVYTSLECQTQYNLIPISSVDQNYCTTNNLCPTYTCPENPIGSGTLSNLYINNILHVGAPNIIMNIPEEIDWDYAYTQGGTTMNIDVVGYNQDFEKIEGWIETNNYKPSSEDFTNIFTSGFSNFGGLLVATLFVILVFYFVKKMFK